MRGSNTRIDKALPGLCLFLYLIAPMIGLQAQSNAPPSPETITDRQGLPQAFVPAIVQDRRGFIWMATLGGLARYDGRHFKVFQPTTDGRPGLSSSGIENLLTDQRGMIWIKTYQGDLDQFDPLRETFVNFTRQPWYQQSVGRDTLESYYPDRQNRLWVWLRNQGLVCFGLTNHRVRRYRHEPGNLASLASNVVTAVVDDGRGQIWVATAAGLDRLDERRGIFVHYHHRATDSTSIPDEVIRVLHRRQNGDLLLLSERYLTALNHQTGQLSRVALPVAEPLWWRHHVGTDSWGNDYLDRANQLFRVSRPTAGAGLQLRPLTKPAPDWRSMGSFVDRSDVLWVGTDATGVRKFNLRAALFESQPYRTAFTADVLTGVLGVSLTQLPRFGAGTNSYNLRSTLDGSGRLWFNVGSTPFYRLDRQTKLITTIPFPVQFVETGSDRPAMLATDPAGRVWAVHDSLVCWYDEPTHRWQRFPYPIRRTGQPSGSVRSDSVGPQVVEAIESPMLQLVVDERALWIITGARGLYRVDRPTGRIWRYSHQPADSTSLSSNNLYSLFADPIDSNSLWVGSAGTGLCRFDKRTGRCQRFTTQNGLPNNVIYAAIPDRQGYVWVATNRGLCRLNRRTGRTRTYTREDGLSADEFNRFHSFYLPGSRSGVQRSGGPASRSDGTDDRIILGGIEGITVFSPGRLREDTYQPVVELTGLRLNNRSVEPGLHSPLGNRPVQMAQILTLPHDQNFLTVDFAALQFNNPGRLRYRYRLEGINRDWTLTDQPEAIYTNLSPGTYTLSLNAANTSGQWSPHVRTLTVVINPPWWARWWARLLYIAMAGGLVLVLVRAYLRQREARHLRAVAQMKEQFFANITHEFRTPLTLLLGPAERIIAESDQAAVRQQGELVQRHGRQLLQLINQLLDLAKLESATLQIEEIRGDLAGFVAEQVQIFGPDAARHGVHLTLKTDLEPGDYWFDRDKLSTVLVNLVSNALKFTPTGGTVAVSLFNSANALVGVSVRDSGIGIAPDQLPHIFDRFYQVGDAGEPRQAGANTRADLSATYRPVGTGIGLALVKELVQLQGGTVTVESTTEAQLADGRLDRGTTFTMTLPYRRAIPGRASPGGAETTSALHPSAKPVQEIRPGLDWPGQSRPGLVPLADEQSTPNAETSAPETDDSPVVLVVEDNADLAAFIADCLPRTYQIHRAVDGRDGLDQARKRIPDLVISDVMMPRMDGYELCRQVKADPLTSHVPVILLTAKAAVASRLEGLAGGADDYLTKPFHVRELQLRVANLLDRQRRQRNWLRATLISPAIPLADPVPANGMPDGPIQSDPIQSDPFLVKLDALMEQHLNDARFGVEELARQVGLSRVHLYRKVKVLSGLTATELLRNYRLKQATRLLGAGHSVTETGYDAGFDSPAYFAKCFRDLYGLTPSDYQRRISDAARQSGDETNPV